MGAGVNKLIVFVKVVNTSKDIKSRHGRCGVIVEKKHTKKMTKEPLVLIWKQKFKKPKQYYM